MRAPGASASARWFTLLAAAAASGIAEAGPAEDAAELTRILGIALWERAASDHPQTVRALRLLAEQAQGIDYASLRMGWHHPNARSEYRKRQHRSFTDQRSRVRTEASHTLLKELITTGGASEAAVTAAFVREIGLKADAPAASGANFGAVLAALEAELLLPLRAYQEHGGKAYRTKPGAPIPPAAVDQVILDITTHVLKGDFSAWRYSNPIGRRQLQGLSEAQVAKWAEPARTKVGNLVVHEGSAGELDFFWATKIGGPSHGFDYEPQCLLPLLANARHKALLVSDPGWPAHPAGRAHLRLLWSQHLKPVLWLETVNVDFAAGGAVNPGPWQRAVLEHVVTKAAAVGSGVSLDPGLAELMASVAAELGLGGVVNHVHETLTLRPSTGIVEASDYLAGAHDWVQMEEQVVGPFHRALYFPVPKGGAEL